ncbi:expressed unknown protein [Seminavis robusta]|uniref:Uncharacterized protein n=1 Tax=Seminavis robusta TaxID=568900 RepID=A0A9N8DV85_9STRA|nr:expressed unknown protein [Seminavis robusta]|eukprot:Sro318_g116040.1 n/a (280) ;mRNA; r:68752-69591
MQRTRGSSSTPLLLRLALLVMMWSEGSSNEEMPEMMPSDTLDEGGFTNLTVSANSSNVTGDNVAPLPPPDLPEICSAASLTTTDGFQLCQDACRKMECCWKLFVASCVSEPVCQGYTPCSNLVSRGINPVEYACDYEYDPADCVSKCAQATCCFATDIEAFCEPDTIVCSYYATCEILYRNANAYTNTAAEEACFSNLQQDLAPCVEVCAEAICCFTTDASKACDVTNPTLDCSEYFACGFLFFNEMNVVDLACYGGHTDECIRLCGPSPSYQACQVLY